MMKKIAGLIIVLITFGCVSGISQMDQITNQVYIGMPIAEFNTVVPEKRLIEMRKDVTVYKVTKKAWHDTDGSDADYRFFYFIDGKLSSIDQGERAVDYRIRID
jgi:hypothetical protein